MAHLSNQYDRRLFSFPTVVNRPASVELSADVPVSIPFTGHFIFDTSTPRQIKKTKGHYYDNSSKVKADPNRIQMKG